jgi:hypothetical protein
MYMSDTLDGNFFVVERTSEEGTSDREWKRRLYLQVTTDNHLNKMVSHEVHIRLGLKLPIRCVPLIATHRT